MARTSTLSKLVVSLVAETEEFERGLTRASRALTKTAKSFEATGRTLTTNVTLPILAIGTAAVKAASDFEGAMSGLQDVAGATAAEVAALKPAVLDLAGAVAQSPRDLAKSLEYVYRTGRRGAEAMEMLRVASKASAAGFGDVQAIVDAASTAIEVYGKQNLSAGLAVSGLMMAAREGKASIADMGQALGQVLPFARDLNIGLDQMGAAFAVLSQRGIKAESSAMALKSVFIAISRPSKDAIAAFRDMGLTAEGLRRKIREEGLLSALGTIAEKLDMDTAAINRVFPNARALASVLGLMSASGDQARGTFDRLAATTTDVLNASFAAAAEDSGFKFKQAYAEIEVLMIRLGDKVLPAILPMVTALAGKVGDLAQKFSELTPQTQANAIALVAIAVAAGPVSLALGGVARTLKAVILVIKTLAVFGVSGFGMVALGATELYAAIIQAGWAIAAFLKGPLSGAALRLFAKDLWIIAQLLMGPLWWAIIAVTACFGLWIYRWKELKEAFATLLHFMRNGVKDFIDEYIPLLGKLLDMMGRIGGSLASLKGSGGLKPDENAFVGPQMPWYIAAGRDMEGIIAKGASMAQSFLKIGESATAGLGAVTASAEPASQALAAVQTQAAAVAVSTTAMSDQLGSVLDGMQADVMSTFAAIKADMSSASEGAIPRMQSRMKSMAVASETSMGAMTAAFAKGKTSIGQFVQQMIMEIGKLIAKMMVLRALTSIGFGDAFAGGFIGGMFAQGGRPEVGKVSLVGEKGPELWIPDTAGRITPLSESGGGGTGDVVLHNTFNLSGADFGDSAAIKRILRGVTKELARQTAEAVAFARTSGDVNAQNAGRAVA